MAVITEYFQKLNQEQKKLYDKMVKKGYVANSDPDKVLAIQESIIEDLTPQQAAMADIMLDECNDTCSSDSSVSFILAQADISELIKITPITIQHLKTAFGTGGDVKENCTKAEQALKMVTLVGLTKMEDSL